MQTADEMKARLEHCFRKIAQERMDGVPILNHAINVEAVGLRQWQDNWLCVLVTPWFMNVMLLPTADGADVKSQEGIRVGTKKNYAFPGGQFEFIRGLEDEIGGYWACSLFSPVLEFGDHETAIATAAAALEAIFETAEDATEQEQEMAMIWAGKLPDDAAEEEANDEPLAASGDATDNEDEDAAVLSRRTFLRGKTKEAQA